MKRSGSTSRGPRRNKQQTGLRPREPGHRAGFFVFGSRAANPRYHDQIQRNTFSGVGARSGAMFRGSWNQKTTTGRTERGSGAWNTGLEYEPITGERPQGRGGPGVRGSDVSEPGQLRKYTGTPPTELKKKRYRTPRTPRTRPRRTGLRQTPSYRT